MEKRSNSRERIRRGIQEYVAARRRLNGWFLVAFLLVLIGPFFFFRITAKEEISSKTPTENPPVEFYFVPEKIALDKEHLPEACILSWKNIGLGCLLGNSEALLLPDGKWGFTAEQHPVWKNNPPVPVSFQPTFSVFERKTLYGNQLIPRRLYSLRYGDWERGGAFFDEKSASIRGNRPTVGEGSWGSILWLSSDLKKMENPPKITTEEVETAAKGKAKELEGCTRLAVIQQEERLPRIVVVQSCSVPELDCLATRKLRQYLQSSFCFSGKTCAMMEKPYLLVDVYWNL